MVTIRVKFHDWQASDIHRIRNFGEDLWREFRDNKHVIIDLQPIDRCVDEITFDARGRYVRRALKETERVMRGHMLEAEIRIEDGSTQA